jgi:hypothetical protein
MANPQPRQEIVNRLRQAITSDAEVDARTTVLLGLAYHTGLLRAVLGRQLLKERKQRIKDIAKAEAAMAATAQAAAAAQIAIMAARSAAVAASAS